jgi:hypothetical protein
VKWNEAIVWKGGENLEYYCQRGNRADVPAKPGYYVFVVGKNEPCPGRCLYLGRALAKKGLHQRLQSYLRSDVSAEDVAVTTHPGKRRLFAARIKGVDGRGTPSSNTGLRDRQLYLFWWPQRPASYEKAKMLEHSLIHFFMPEYNTFDENRELGIDLDDEIEGVIR